MPRFLPLTWDIYTGELSFDRSSGRYFKRFEPVTISLTVENDGVAGTIPSATTGTLKPVNDYSTVLAQFSSFAQVGITNVYTASTTLNSSAINTLLGAVSERWNCIFDFSGSGGKSDTLAIPLENDVTRSSDGPVSPAGAADYYAGVVSGYADGTWAGGLVTAGLSFGLYKFVDEDGILRQFILRASVSATALPGIRRPDDYNSSTNARAFFQVA